jgi:hypothetical protein
MAVVPPLGPGRCLNSDFFMPLMRQLSVLHAVLVSAIVWQSITCYGMGQQRGV